MATQGYEGRFRTIDLTKGAEGIIASAFYLFPSPRPSPQRGEGKGEGN